MANAQWLREVRHGFLLLALLLAPVGVWGQGGGERDSGAWTLQHNPSAVMAVRAPVVLDPTGPNRVVMQIIDNVFHKWHEYDVGQSGEFYVVQLEPSFGRLTAREAKALLAASGTWMDQVPNTEDYYWLDPTDPRLRASPVPVDQSMMPYSGADAPSDPDVGTAPVTTVPFDWRAVDPAPGAELSPEVVIGTDDRVRVTCFASTTVYPWNTIGYVAISFPNGQGFRGTGFLISPYAILTNAHNVYARDKGGFITSLEFSPGQHQASQGAPVQRPYGSRDAVRIRTNTSYVDAVTNPSVNQYDYDYAAAFFNAVFGGISTFMPLVFDQSPTHINIAGYPGAAGSETNTRDMWYSHSAVTSVLARRLEYTADTSGGNSGGPVWQFFSNTGERRVVAVHAYGNASIPVNGGTRLTSHNQSLIEEWMRWTPQDQPPSNRPPTVQLTYTPTNPTTSDTIVFTATASDPDGDPLTFAWYLNGVQQNVSNTTSQVTWANPPAGTHTLRVVVADGRGGTAEDSVTFAVTATPPPPTPGDGNTHRYGNVMGWYMISVPVQAGAPSGITMWSWNQGTGLYDVPGTLQPQKGYWAWLNANTQLSVTGAPPSSDVTLVLGPSGWHQIGAPWSYPKAAIQVIRGGETRTWAQAVAAGWLRNPIYGWKATGGAYTMPTMLHPWYGYWLEAKVSGLSLRFVYSMRSIGMTTGWVLDAVPLAAGPLDLPPMPPTQGGATGLIVGNHPNPVMQGETTTFRVSGHLAVSVSELRVAVFDLSGRKVWEGTSSGAELDWNTDDRSGRLLTNGVYLYQIWARVHDSWVSTGLEKLVIIR